MPPYHDDARRTRSARGILPKPAPAARTRDSVAGTANRAGTAHGNEVRGNGGSNRDGDHPATKRSAPLPTAVRGSLRSGCPHHGGDGLWQADGVDGVGGDGIGA